MMGLIENCFDNIGYDALSKNSLTKLMAVLVEDGLTFLHL
jgi:hypothetical protein